MTQETLKKANAAHKRVIQLDESLKYINRDVYKGLNRDLYDTLPSDVVQFLQNTIKEEIETQLHEAKKEFEEM